MSRVTRRPAPRNLCLLVTGEASLETRSSKGAGGRGAVLVDSGEECVGWAHPLPSPLATF